MTTAHRPPFYLRFINDWDDRWTEARGSVHYFCNLGKMWPHDPTRRLIERTSRNRDEARQFVSPAEAQEILVSAGSPRGWSVVDGNGVAVE